MNTLIKNDVTKNIKDWANFILREIRDGVETDTILGGFYSYIDREKATEIFNETAKEWSESDLNGCYAIISFFDESYIPLYSGSTYYIMTDTGGTVANRTKK